MNIINPYRYSGSVSTSYNNSGGTGDRTGVITVTFTGSFNGTASGTPSVVVDGITSGAVNLYFNNNAASSYAITFDFGIARVINEAKFYQENTTTHGTWKWQGSNDNSNWTDIGGSFTLGGVATQTHTSLNGNITSYRYYKLVGVSGTCSNSPWLYEFEFKIDYSSTAMKTSLVAWWDFDNSLTNKANAGTLDATSRGTSQGYATDPFGNANGALDLSSTSWASVAGTAAFDPAGNFSLVWWMKDALAYTGSSYFIWKWDTSHQFYVNRQTTTNDRLFLALANDAAGGEERQLGVNGDYPGDDGNWHHYAITYKSSTSTAKFYVDGVLKETGETYVTETGAINAVGTANSLIIGNSHLTNAAGVQSGAMARMSWWHRLLTDSEVSALYNSGNDLKYANL